MVTDKATARREELIARLLAVADAARAGNSDQAQLELVRDQLSSEGFEVQDKIAIAQSFVQGDIDRVTAERLLRDAMSKPQQPEMAPPIRDEAPQVASQSTGGNEMSGIAAYVNPARGRGR